MKKETLKNECLDARSKYKPNFWQEKPTFGQICFDYVEFKWGVARKVANAHGCDCSADESLTEMFLECAAKEITEWERLRGL